MYQVGIVRIVRIKNEMIPTSLCKMKAKETCGTVASGLAGEAPLS